MRILVADKDKANRTLIAARLTARDYDVIEIDNSLSVLRILEKETIDLVILSRDMERINGKLLIERIRDRPQRMTIPIILITEENKIAELVMSHERGFDDFLTKPFSPLELQLRVAINISRARQRVEANALTHLPGNHSIERVVRTKIEAGEKFSVLYLDIDQFKAFNDRYGFEKGDDVIRQTAKILVRVGEEIAADKGCFIGHIGGDDFVVVIDPGLEEPYARRFIEEFDRIMLTYYNDEDRRRGNVRITNRQGKRQTVPLMSCSIAACTNLYRNYTSLGEIAHDAAELKSFLKSQTGSHYLRDRRASPFRQPREALEALAPDIHEDVELESLNPEPTAVDPMGQILVAAGLITKAQLNTALKKHLETGERLGQVLIRMNAVRSKDVGQLLQKKLNISYVSLDEAEPTREALRLFTLEFMKSHRVVPLRVDEQAIKLGMCDPFDLKTLDAIERITKLKPEPLLALEDEFEQFLEKYQEDPDSFKQEKIG